MLKINSVTTAQETPIRDIAYNFLIDPFGTIYEGVGWEYQGQHTLNLNDKCLGVAVIGTFASAPPTEAALSSLHALINMGLSDGPNAGVSSYVDIVKAIGVYIFYQL